MKLKYKLFEDRGFQLAVQKLADYPFRNQLTAYNVARLFKKFGQEAETAQTLWIKLLKQFAELDQNGNFKPLEVTQSDGSISKDFNKFVVADEKKDDFKKAEAEFGELEFEVPCTPLKLSDIEMVDCSAKELLALEPILDTKLIESYSSSSAPSEVSAESAA